MPDFRDFLCIIYILRPATLVAVPELHHLLTIHWDDREMAVSTRPNTETEKITINLGFVDLGSIDLLVRESVFANRTDFIRTAIRNELARHDEIARQVKVRDTPVLGIRHVVRADLEAARDEGEMLDFRVLGLLSIANDVDAELAQTTIRSISILGAFHAPPKVKSALADRLA